jgi:hypothetical protein
LWGVAYFFVFAKPKEASPPSGAPAPPPPPPPPKSDHMVDQYGN